MVTTPRDPARQALPVPPAAFDRILALDTLEHLPEPAKLLRELRTLLAPRAKLLVSAPNSVHLLVRLMVLFGRFRYSDRGILDWSHLRFFTRRTLEELLEQNGYRITARHYTIVPLERVVPLAPGNRLLRFASRVLRVITALAPTLFAYEILLVVER